LGGGGYQQSVYVFIYVFFISAQNSTRRGTPESLRTQARGRPTERVATTKTGRPIEKGNTPVCQIFQLVESIGAKLRTFSQPALLEPTLQGASLG